jgi:type II secretory pathway predicted ATPase ExeA
MRPAGPNHEPRAEPHGKETELKEMPNMSLQAASGPPAADRPSLTAPQEATVAKLAYATGQPGAIALVCGPAGVGKTTVLRVLAGDGLPQGRTSRLISWGDLRPDRGLAPAGDDDLGADVLLLDDAHRATAHELVALLERYRRRSGDTAFVLAGEGRLLSLVAADARLEQSVRLRAALPTFTLAESRRLLVPALAVDMDEEDAEALIRTIHEIAGGAPAISLRLAEMTAMLAAADRHRRLTSDDVETIHRRVSLSAA